MSVLIKGMKMPKSCLLCPFGDEFGKCCVNAELEDSNELTHSCPLVELPDHGELIDRDALKEPMESVCMGIMAGTDSYNAPLKTIDDAPVIIPAERSEASLCENCDQRNDKGCCVCKYIKERSEE